jgi:hypothetical protein
VNQPGPLSSALAAKAHCFDVPLNEDVPHLAAAKPRPRAERCGLREPDELRPKARRELGVVYGLNRLICNVDVAECSSHTAPTSSGYVPLATDL